MILTNMITSELLYVIENGDILHMSEAQEYAMKKLKWALAQHKERIFVNSRGMWQTSFDCQGGYRDKKKVTRKNKHDLYNEIIEYYSRKATNFHTVYEEWIDFKRQTNSIKPQSITKYDNDYRRFVENTEFEQVSVEDLDEKILLNFIIDQIKNKNLTTKVFSGLKIILESTLKYAWMHGYKLKFSPSEFFNNLDVAGLCAPPRGRKEAFSDKEAKIIIDSCNKTGDTISLCIMIAFYTGVRIGELTSIKWDDVDFDKRTISINKTAVVYKDRDTGKRVHIVQDCPKTSASTRIISMSDEVTKVLKRLYAITGKYDFVCTNIKNGNRIQSSTVQKRLSRVCEKCNVRSLGVHGIRRMVGTKLLDTPNVSTDTVRKIMGHTDIKTTETYYHRTQTDYLEERNIMNQIFSYGT